MKTPHVHQGNAVAGRGYDTVTGIARSPPIGGPYLSGPLKDRKSQDRCQCTQENYFVGIGWHYPAGTLDRRTAW